MNYRPNPFGSAMAARLRLSRSNASHATLACLHTTDPGDKVWYGSRFYRRFVQGATDQALAQGYDLQPFYLCGREMTGKRLSSILLARGINGILVPPIQNPTKSLGFKWDNFAVATIGFYFNHPALHCSMNRHDHTIWLTLQEMIRLGYRRIGLLVLRASEVLAERAFASGFLLYQSELPEKLRVPIFTARVNDEEINFKTFKNWVTKHRPEVVISLGMGNHILGWLQEMNWKVPEDVGVADMDIHPPTTMAGLDQLHELVGAAAVDLVLGQIHHSERGVPAHPKTVMLEGIWRSGSTVREMA